MYLMESSEVMSFSHGALVIVEELDWVNPVA